MYEIVTTTATQHIKHADIKLFNLSNVVPLQRLILYTNADQILMMIEYLLIVMF